MEAHWKNARYKQHKLTQNDCQRENCILYLFHTCCCRAIEIFYSLSHLVSITRTGGFATIKHSANIINVLNVQYDLTINGKLYYG